MRGKVPDSVGARLSSIQPSRVPIIALIVSELLQRAVDVGRCPASLHRCYLLKESVVRWMRVVTMHPGKPACGYTGPCLIRRSTTSYTSCSGRRVPPHSIGPLWFVATNNARMSEIPHAKTNTRNCFKLRLSASGITNRLRKSVSQCGRGLFASL